MPAYEIPLTPDAQTLNVNLAGTKYIFCLLWNTDSLSWNLDIEDHLGVPIVTGLALVADVDLLAPYTNLNFGGQLIAQTDDLPGANPTYENLGSTSHLYFVTP